MKKIKVFQSDYHLQETIDHWIAKKNLNIISVSSSMACSAHGVTYTLVTILYEENDHSVTNFI